MSIRENYTKYNSETWNRWADENDIWTRPIDHETYINALNGIWEIGLTPLKNVPKDWFLPFDNAKLLGLASGGGQQMPIFTALGADVTVFDYSDRQLESEKMVSEREGYSINLVKGDMTKRLPFEDNSFDMIFHPVSNSFIEDVEHVWRECFRVLKKGGVLLAGFSNPMVYLFEGDETLDKLHVVNKLPYNPLKDCTEEELAAIYAADGVQFSHSLETQIGGQL
jgi:SAM-dependent methyltransferase